MEVIGILVYAPRFDISILYCGLYLMANKFQFPQDKGRPLPKFGEWDVNDPASAEGFTVIFNKARNEKRTGGKSDSPPKDDSTYKHGETLGKPHSKKWFCCMQSTSAES
ncbi:RPM1-interacting protein 4-like [Olea europaea var. sylvestris]|uniref:RPM1-interacting protein 4-like n=1 Tax=Olea europaea var. sylvestris TaxID=158386 RepID=UPI000C1D3222|nr:RPM1-interacting protein 4-like [Olea europaea var. sylvestris]